MRKFINSIKARVSNVKGSAPKPSDKDKKGSAPSSSGNTDSFLFEVIGQL